VNVPGTGLVSSPKFLAHDTGATHPERPERLQAISARLEGSGLLEELERAEAPMAEVSWIEAVHDAAHVASVQEAIEAGRASLDVDTPVCRASWEAALCAVGGALLAADRVVAGQWENAFVAARPPGHHAEHDRSMGFCLFNNIVITARYLQRHHDLERIAILDWDVHHGNGTQHLTEDDPSVLFVSLHQFPHYPGTGARGERGQGEGEGSVVNCPMDAGSGDAEYLRAFESDVLPAIEAFDPEFVLVSAGFDAHLRDPLSATRVSAQGFQSMSEGICDLARERCGGRLVSMLEGGYDLEGLSESIEAHLGVLVDAPAE
jgi:acetoin utilization deacetylase AcuC-like enzyme